jgi:tRNA threonylcarbamoyladenosine biosynthesis protein TsaB
MLVAVVILALDAATSTVVLGLASPDGQILSERRLKGARGDVLPGLLEECLTEIGAKTSDISRVVCGVGPGSFTGIRIALSFGHGIAFRRNLPYQGVSSLAATLQTAQFCSTRPVAAVLDALRGEAYVRPFGTDRDIRMPIEELTEFLDGPQLVVEGRPDFLERLPAGWHDLSKHVTAKNLIGALRHDATDPVPNYLRASAPEELRDGK